jgi:hypothetical protein
MKNVLEKRTENLHTFYVQRIPPPPTIVCRLGDNVETYCRADRSQLTIWRMRTACWIINAANTHSEYVILIAFLL